MQLTNYEAAKSALALCHSIDEVKDIRDKAEALAAYARQAKDHDLILYATEIKVKAERRCGEMLAETERARAGRPRTILSMDTTDFQRLAESPPTLEQMGLTRDESSRYQQLAAMPIDAFETAIETAKAVVGEVTTAFLLREAKALQAPQPSRPPRKVTLLCPEPADDIEIYRKWFALLCTITGMRTMDEISNYVRVLVHGKETA